MVLSKCQRELILRASVREGGFYPETKREVGIVAALEVKGLMEDREWWTRKHVKGTAKRKKVKCKALTKAGMAYVVGELTKGGK